MRTLIAISLAATLAGPCAAAGAPCVVPVPPDQAQRPAKPTPPERSACVDAKPGTTGCFGWEAYSYNDAVKAFNAKMPAYKAAADGYVAKLNAFVQASADYARCEVRILQQ